MAESVITVTPPAVEPVSLAEAKLHLRVDHSTEDALIAALVSAAREDVESDSWRAVAAQTLRLDLDGFPDNDEDIILPRPPLVSVTSIVYTDPDGDQQTMDSDDYVVQAAGDRCGRISLASGVSWPSTLDQAAVVSITFAAGYPAARISTAARSSNVVTVTTDGAHGISNGSMVAVSGLADSTFDARARVTVTAATTFTYANTGDNGSTTGGQATAIPDRLRSAVLLKAQLLYERGDGGAPNVLDQVRRAYEALVAGASNGAKRYA